MKAALGLIFTLSSLNIFASELGFKVCGEYHIKGNLVAQQTDVKYLVFEKSKSEMQFEIKKPEDLALISSYLNVATTLTAIIDKKMDGTKGEIASILKVELRRPDPLKPLQSMGLRLIKERPCSI